MTMTSITDLVPGFGDGQYLKSSELPPGGLRVIIDRLTVAQLQERNGPRSKPVLQLVGQHKGHVLNIINSRVLEQLFGKDINSWTGKEVLLVSEPVQGPNGPTTGIRIHPAPPQVTASASQPASTLPAAPAASQAAAPPPTAAPASDPAAALASLSPEQLHALLAQHLKKTNGGSWSE